MCSDSTSGSTAGADKALQATSEACLRQSHPRTTALVPFSLCCSTLPASAPIQRPQHSYGNRPACRAAACFCVQTPFLAVGAEEGSCGVAAGECLGTEEVPRSELATSVSQACASPRDCFPLKVSQSWFSHIIRSVLKPPRLRRVLGWFSHVGTGVTV